MRRRVLVFSIVGAVIFFAVAGGALAYFLVGSNALTNGVHTAKAQPLVLSPTPVFHEFEWYPGSTATKTVTIENPVGNPPLRVRLFGTVGFSEPGLADALRLEIPALGYVGTVSQFAASGTEWSGDKVPAGGSLSVDITLTFVDDGTDQTALASSTDHDSKIDFDFQAQGKN